MIGQVHETGAMKIDANTSPRGEDGLRHLAGSQKMAMRLWDKEEPGDWEPAHSHAYETVGYVVDGRAELQIEGQTLTLGPGDSWVVPAGARHAYRTVERFTAVEATHPSYRAGGEKAQPNS